MLIDVGHSVGVVLLFSRKPTKLTSFLLLFTISLISPSFWNRTNRPTSCKVLPSKQQRRPHVDRKELVQRNHRHRSLLMARGLHKLRLSVNRFITLSNSLTLIYKK